MAHQRKIEYVTQLKKSFATIQNGFKAYMAKEGVTTIEDTTLWQKMPGDNTDTGDITEFQKELENIFIATKQFKNNELSGDYLITYDYLDNSDNMKFNFFESVFLNDGSIMYYTFYKKDMNNESRHAKIRSLGGKYVQNYGVVAVDVNGLKKPNKFGRDIFAFVFTYDGSLIPYGSKDAALLELQNITSTWDGSDVDNNCLTTGSSSGMGCAARIIDEGWEMKY